MEVYTRRNEDGKLGKDRKIREKGRKRKKPKIAPLSRFLDRVIILTDNFETSHDCIGGRDVKFARKFFLAFLA